MSLEKMFERVIGVKPPKRSARPKGKAVRRPKKAKKPAVRKTKERTSTDKLFDSVTRLLKKFEHTKYGKYSLKETAVEMQLVQFLRGRLPAKYRNQVVYEKEIGRGRLDISIANEVGIELKLSPTSSELDRLHGQIIKYMDSGDFKRMAVLVIAGDARSEMLAERKRLIEDKNRGKVRVIIR